MTYFELVKFCLSWILCEGLFVEYLEVINKVTMSLSLACISAVAKLSLFFSKLTAASNFDRKICSVLQYYIGFTISHKRSNMARAEEE